MKSCTRFSVLLVISLLSQEPRGALANFFSKILNFENANGDAPSGSRNAKGQASGIAFNEGVLMVHLANNKRIPLVGLGVGHSPAKYVSALVAEAVQDDKRVRLIDAPSGNEELVAEGILASAEQLKQGEKLEVHVVTKVWYTHLGYERTKLAVEDSMRALLPVFENDKVNLKVHLMLNWPRCYEGVSWMDCASEEESLDQRVKDAGTDPTKNSNAWQGSWKYLEDAYTSGKFPIESIGLSNFQLDDIENMDSFARIAPHVLQVSLWSLINDSHLVDFCHKNHIHLQVFNALQWTIARPGRAPHAFRHIRKVAIELSKETGLTVSPAQTVLAWLIQHGVSVIPSTTKLRRLEENSAIALSSIPTLTDAQVSTVAHAVEAFLSGDDLETDLHVAVTFHAISEDVMLYWVLPDGREIRIDHIRKGDSFNETTYPDHVYRTYYAYNKDIYAEHRIDANFGEHKQIYVDKFDHDDRIENASIPGLTGLHQGSIGRETE